MTLPLFYMASGDREEIRPGGREEIRRGDREEIRLDEDNSRHIVQVLRMGPGEDLLLADGKGNLLTARIKDADKKKCLVSITTRAFYPPPEKKVAIAISPLKNASRFEWFLEKATEIGVPMVIAVVDKGGNLVALHRMDQALLVSIDIAWNKAYTAVAVKVPTHELAQLAQPGQPLFGIHNADGGRVVIFGGGYPLQVDGDIVGGIGVSGGSVEEDMQCAEAALEQLGKR